MDPFTIAILGAFALISKALEEDRKEQRTQCLIRRTAADIHEMEELAAETKQQMRVVAASHRNQFARSLQR